MFPAAGLARVPAGAADRQLGGVAEWSCYPDASDAESVKPEEEVWFSHCFLFSGSL